MSFGQGNHRPSPMPCRRSFPPWDRAVIGRALAPDRTPVYNARYQKQAVKAEVAPIVKIRAPSDQTGSAPAGGPRPLGHSLCRCIGDVHAALRLRTDCQTDRPTDRTDAESADSTCLSRGMRRGIIRPFISWTAHALCRCPFRRENKGIDKGVGKVQEGMQLSSIFDQKLHHPCSSFTSLLPLLLSFFSFSLPYDVATSLLLFLYSFTLHSLLLLILTLLLHSLPADFSNSSVLLYIF